MSENPYKYESDIIQDNDEHRPVGVFYDTTNFFVPMLIFFLTPAIPIIVGNTANYLYSVGAWIGIAWPFSIYTIYRYFKNNK